MPDDNALSSPPRMSSRSLSAYPWHALEKVDRGSARRARSARRQLAELLDLERIGHALGELIECEVSIVVRRVSGEAPRRRPAASVGFEIGTRGVLAALSVEPEFATTVLARLLRRPVTLTSSAALDDALLGALQAAALEVARRAGARAPLYVVDAAEAIARACDVFLEATVLVAGVAFQVVAAVALPAIEAPAGDPWSALGAIEIAVPVVIGVSLAERTAFGDFKPGNAWFPGDGLWLRNVREGSVVLAAANHDFGVSASLSPDGQIVLRGQTIPLLPDAGTAMSEADKTDAPRLEDAVLDSPLVVRIEMGAVSLSAREWAELGPGDVIETGRRIAEPVILRIAGREVARGELVNLEGELGVRIREVVRS